MFSTYKGVPMAQVSGPSGSVSAPGGWHPTVLYMLALVAAEMVAVALLARVLR